MHVKKYYNKIKWINKYKSKYLLFFQNHLIYYFNWLFMHVFMYLLIQLFLLLSFLVLHGDWQDILQVPYIYLGQWWSIVNLVLAAFLNGLIACAF